MFRILICLSLMCTTRVALGVDPSYASGVNPKSFLSVYVNKGYLYPGPNNSVIHKKQNTSASEYWNVIAAKNGIYVRLDRSESYLRVNDKLEVFLGQSTENTTIWVPKSKRGGKIPGNVILTTTVDGKEYEFQFDENGKGVLGDKGVELSFDYVAK